MVKISKRFRRDSDVSVISIKSAKDGEEFYQFDE